MYIGSGSRAGALKFLDSREILVHPFLSPSAHTRPKVLKCFETSSSLSPPSLSPLQYKDTIIVFWRTTRPKARGGGVLLLLGDPKPLLPQAMSTSASQPSLPSPCLESTSPLPPTVISSERNHIKIHNEAPLLQPTGAPPSQHTVCPLLSLSLQRAQFQFYLL